MSTEVVLYGLKMINHPGDGLPGDLVESFPMVVDYINVGMGPAMNDLKDMSDCHPDVLRDIPTEVEGLEQLLVLDNKKMIELVEQHQLTFNLLYNSNLEGIVTEMKANPELVWWVHIEY